jgi:hypothetical protein
MDWGELTVAYLIIGVLVIGLPTIFFLITFIPGLMRTTGEAIGAEQNSLAQEDHVRQRVSSSSASIARTPRKSKSQPSRNFANTP